MTSIIDASSLDEPVVIVTRMFDAPRTLVWDVITDPKHVVHWYGGPGFTNPVCEMDLRPGGVWRTGPHGALSVSRGAPVRPEAWPVSWDGGGASTQ